MPKSDELLPKHSRASLFLSLLAATLLSVLLFEAVYFALGYNYFNPPIALNLKLHEANKNFSVSPSNSVKKLSNETLEQGEFEIQIGPSNEILSEAKCRPGDFLIYAIGTSTTEQKLVKKGLRWVDQLNMQFNRNRKGYCIQNFGYGGVNLKHIADTQYFLFSRQIPSAVILMSNATDVGHLMRYGSYEKTGNHFSKQRVVINGEVKKRDQYFPGLRTVLAKFWRVPSKNQMNEFDRSLSSDQIVGAYITKLESIAKFAGAYGVPFIYINEPRLTDLSGQSPQRREMILEHYKAANVDYFEMSDIHKKISSKVKMLNDDLIDCVIDTTAFNNSKMLYDEGHLNVKGSELLANLIYNQISTGGLCELG